MSTFSCCSVVNASNELIRSFVAIVRCRFCCLSDITNTGIPVSTNRRFTRRIVFLPFSLPWDMTKYAWFINCKLKCRKDESHNTCSFCETGKSRFVVSTNSNAAVLSTIKEFIIVWLSWTMHVSQKWFNWTIRKQQITTIEIKTQSIKIKMRILDRSQVHALHFMITT